MIEVTLNGEVTKVEDGLKLDQLLESLDLPSTRIAVERNRRVVPRASFSTEPIESGDILEVVTFVGGG